MIYFFAAHVRVFLRVNDFQRILIMFNSLVITLNFCVMISSFNLISSYEMIISDINLKNLSKKYFGAQNSFKNEQVASFL